MKRKIAAVLVVGLIVLGACGGAHRAGAGRSLPKVSSVAYCGFHAFRLAADAAHGSYGFAAYQAWRTAHSCKRLAHRR